MREERARAEAASGARSAWALDAAPDASRSAGLPGHEVGDALVSMRGAGRTFGDVAALADIDLSVAPGHLFGLVGPSGCGKTTLARLVVGLLEPSEGEVEVLGTDPRGFGVRERREIGYLPQEFSLYPNLTVQQNARFVAGLYGLGWLHRRKRIREVLEFLELWDARKRLAGDLSGGMKRRLSLACALLHRPSLLVVDEPTAGLDPVLRMRIWDMLRGIQEQGTTVFMTTQYIEEAERCDSVAVMRGGRIVASGTPSDLRARASLPDTVVVELDDVRPGDTRSLWEVEGVSHVRQDGQRQLHVVAERGERAIPDITDALAGRGRTVIAIDARQASFEDVFLSLVEQARRDEEEQARREIEGSEVEGRAAGADGRSGNSTAGSEARQ